MPRPHPTTGAGFSETPLGAPGYARAERGHIRPLRTREDPVAPPADPPLGRGADRPAIVPRVVLPDEDDPLTPRQEISGLPVAPWRTARGGRKPSAARPRAGPGEAWERTPSASATPRGLPAESRERGARAQSETPSQIRRRQASRPWPPADRAREAKAQGEFGAYTDAPESTAAELTISRSRLLYRLTRQPDTH